MQTFYSHVRFVTPTGKYYSALISYSAENFTSSVTTLTAFCAGVELLSSLKVEVYGISKNRPKGTAVSLHIGEALKDPGLEAWLLENRP
jgi:hypothetical protein